MLIIVFIGNLSVWPPKIWCSVVAQSVPFFSVATSVHQLYKASSGCCPVLGLGLLGIPADIYANQEAIILLKKR